jgi:uncharacterized damage-inducible protein DinB
MIDAAFVRMMARYNSWQNKQLSPVVEAMNEKDLAADRGAFFGSIFATLNHLLWADRIWMSRFSDEFEKPSGGIAESVELTPTISVWSAERFQIDGRIRLWADDLDTVALRGNLAWYSGAAGREVTKPVALCVAHMFNHQTHHRGQLHAMLTAAGKEAPVSDLFLMPEEG